MNSMTAAVYREGAGVTVEQVPIPRIAPGELLVRMRSASICATDLRILDGAHRKFGPGVRRIPGHEITATIEEVGSQVKGFVPGQAVFLAPNIGCGACVCCRRGKNNLCPQYEAFGITLDGAFAEFMRVTAPAIEQGNVMPLPPNCDLSVAALTEPFACVVHGQEAVAVSAGDVVVVLGAGPIGVMHSMAAHALGARHVLLADLAPERLSLARALAPAEVIDLSSGDLAVAVAAASGGAGADAIIVAAPSAEAQRSALALAAPGGRINFFAGLPKTDPFVSLDANLVHYKELVLTGTTACSTANCRRALDLIISGAVDLGPLISARFPLSQAPAAFAAARDRRNLKVVLESSGPTRPLGGTLGEMHAV